MEKVKQQPLIVKSGKIDWSILVLVYMLVFIGIIMIFSASSVQAQMLNGSSTHFLKMQCIYAAAGTVALFLAANINYEIYKKYAISIYALNILLLFLTLTVGVVKNDAKRWLGYGVLTFQTSDYTKIAMIITTAYFIDKYRHKLSNINIISIPAGALALSLSLIYFQPSFSALVTVAIPSVVMLFVGGMSGYLVLLGGIAGVAGLTVLMLSAEYRKDRITTFFDPFSDPSGKGWQIINSFFAISSGGIWGRGFGKSTQKYFYISQPQNDFIFAVIAEELGLVGSILIILIYVVLIFKLFRLVLDVDDIFAKMIVLGVAIQTGIQVILNIGIATGGIPNTGVGLPFISYGGTSVIMFLSMFGIVLNISKHRKIYKKTKVKRG